MGNACTSEAPASTHVSVAYIEQMKEEVKEELRKELRKELRQELQEEFRDWIKNEIKSENEKISKSEQERKPSDRQEEEVGNDDRQEEEEGNNDIVQQNEFSKPDDDVKKMTSREDAITYDEALEKLGGIEEIIKYQKASEELKEKLGDKTLDNHIQELLPLSHDHVATSTKLINQPFVNTIEDLYELARGIEYYFQKVIKNIAKETSSTAIIPPLKDIKRAKNKAEFKYRDHLGNGVAYYRLTDIIRATLTFDSIQAMYEALKIILSSSKFKVKELNDRFQNPKEDGYRDIQLVIELEGFMCELQLSTEVMIQAKETSGNRNHEVYRELKDAVTTRNLQRVKAALKFGKDQLGSSIMSTDFMRIDSFRSLPHEAAKVGDVEILDCLLQSGADVNAQDESGETPLHHAIFNGYERCVWLLLNKYKSKIDIKNHENECPVTKGYLMTYGGKPEPFIRAMMTLLQAANIDQVNDAALMRHDIISKKLVKNSLLGIYATDGNVTKMKELLQAYVDPNSSVDGKTAIQIALHKNHTDAINLLVDFNACFDKSEWSALVDHAERGNLTKVTKLLDLDIDPNSNRDGLTALEAAQSNDHCDIVKVLQNSGASCKDVAPKQYTIPCGVNGSRKWAGIAQYKTKIFCCPCNATSVLIYDTATESIKTVDCGVGGSSKWIGIARYKDKLFCAPHNAAAVLVINGETEEKHSIKLKVKGSEKWQGIVSCSNKLYCAPFNASSVLVIDGETEKIETIPCDVYGEEKWSDIAVYGTKLFCCPYNASSVLVIDSKTKKLHKISLKDVDDTDGVQKWQGIVNYGNKLYCAPCNAPSILVIDGDTEKISTIPCGISGEWKWRGIERFGDKLICSPCKASSVLIIDGKTGKTTFRPCHETGGSKWSGIVQCGTKLICSPFGSKDILIMEDQTIHLGLGHNANEGNDRSGKKPLKSGFLVDCVRNGMIDKMKELIMMGIDPNSTRDTISALLAAVRGNDINAVELLLESKASVDDQEHQVSIVDEAIKQKNANIVKVLNDHGASSHLFVNYAGLGDLVKMKELLKKYSINPNSTQRGVSALQAAVRGNYQAAVELLINEKVSTNCNIGELHAILEALECGHIEIAQFLYKAGVKSNDVTLVTRRVSCGKNTSRKWAGIAQYDNTLFCCPCDASSVLVFNTENEKIKTLNWRTSGSMKWVGITRYGNKLFCAPYNATEILVINGKTEKLRTIRLDVQGSEKWQGIVVCGSKLYCAPFNASSVLVIDGESEKIETISCDVYGEQKWSDIAVYGTKLFCCPYNASSVLVIDSKSKKMHTISLNSVDGGDEFRKWQGIVNYGNKLYCAPFNASSILVIDGDTEKISTIPCGIDGDRKWSGIECFGNKIVCSPYNASSILIIDGETEKVSSRPCGDNDSSKWWGIAQCGTKLVCNPFGSNDLLLLEDYENVLRNPKKYKDSLALHRRLSLKSKEGLEVDITSKSKGIITTEKVPSKDLRNLHKSKEEDQNFSEAKKIKNTHVSSPLKEKMSITTPRSNSKVAFKAKSNNDHRPSGRVKSKDFRSLLKSKEDATTTPKAKANLSNASQLNGNGYRSEKVKLNDFRSVLKPKKVNQNLSDLGKVSDRHHSSPLKGEMSITTPKSKSNLSNKTESNNYRTIEKVESNDSHDLHSILEPKDDHVSLSEMEEADDPHMLSLSEGEFSVPISEEEISVAISDGEISVTISDGEMSVTISVEENSLHGSEEENSTTSFESALDSARSSDSVIDSVNPSISDAEDSESLDHGLELD